jgi:hypothetical protein
VEDLVRRLGVSADENIAEAIASDSTRPAGGSMTLCAPACISRALSDFIATNGFYGKYSVSPFLPRPTIGVAALPLGACVEIDLVGKV